MLAVLIDGLPPCAEPLDCDDMRGPLSFFGESAIMPRPVATLSACCALVKSSSFLLAKYGETPSLWHTQTCASLPDSARDICAAGLQHRLPVQEESERRSLKLNLPVRTYLAGRSLSSFSVAWALHEDGMLPEWAGVICSCQSEGRGRLRRPWHSPRGNLYVSFRLPDDPLFQGDMASLFTGLLIARAFRAMGFALSLKWPNDLLLDEKIKVGGILLEERGGVLLAGLGVNLAEAPTADFLRKEAAVPAGLLLPHGECVPGGGGDYEYLSPFPLWRRLVSEAILGYEQGIVGKDAGALLAELGGLLAWKQRCVTLREEGEAPVTGVFLGLGPSGGALLRLGSGEREFFSGSLSLFS